MKKRILTALLAIAMLMSMAACGGKDTSTPSSDNAETGAQTGTETGGDTAAATDMNIAMVTDSGKQGHYMHSSFDPKKNVPIYYGDVYKCIDAAVAGYWKGEE